MLKPMNTYLLIEVEPEKEQTASGFYIPQSANVMGTKILKAGKILAINDSEELDKLYQVGTTVYFNKHAITEIPDTENQVLVRTEDIYAIEQ